MAVVWLPVVWKELSRGRWSWMPDVPVDENGPLVGFGASLPTEIDKTTPHRRRTGQYISPAEDPSYCYGDPLVGVCRVEIDDKDVSKVKPVTPTDLDRALVEACALIDDPADKRFRDGPAAKTRFREISQAITATGNAKKEIMQRALLEATRRGLRLTDAEDITNEHDLSATIAR